MKHLLFCSLFFLTAQVSAQQPKLTLPVGHTRDITRAEYSDDGRLVVSSGYGSQAFLWEAASGKLLKVFELPAAGAMSTRFAHGSKYIVAVSGNATENAVVWEVESGNAILTGTVGNAEDISFPAPGMITMAHYDSVIVHHVVTGKRFKIKKLNNTPVSAARGMLRVIVQKDNRMFVEKWNVHSGKLQSTTRLINPPETGVTINDAPSGYAPFRFSNTGQFLLMERLHRADSMHLFNTNTGEKMQTIEISRYVSQPPDFNGNDAFLVYYYPNDEHVYIIDLKKNNTSSIPTTPVSEIRVSDSAVYLLQKSRVVVMDTGLTTQSRLTVYHLYARTTKEIFKAYIDIKSISLFDGYLLANFIPFSFYDPPTDHKERFSYPGATKALLFSTRTNAFAGEFEGTYNGSGGRLIHNQRLLLLGKTKLQIDQWDIAGKNQLSRMWGSNQTPKVLAFVDSSHLFTGNRLINFQTGRIVAEIPGAFDDWNQELKLVRMRYDSTAAAVYDVHGNLMAHVKGNLAESNLEDDWSYLFAETDDSLRVAGVGSGTSYSVIGNFEARDEKDQYLITASGSNVADFGWGWNYNIKRTTTEVSDANVYLWNIASGNLLQRTAAEYTSVLTDSAGNFQYMVAEKEIPGKEDYSNRTWIYRFATRDTLEFPGSFKTAGTENRYITTTDGDSTYAFDLATGNKMPVPGDSFQPEPTKNVAPDTSVTIHYTWDSTYMLVYRHSTSQGVVKSRKGTFASHPFSLRPEKVPGKLYFSVSPDQSVIFYTIGSAAHLVIDARTGKYQTLQGVLPSEVFTWSDFMVGDKLLTISEKPTEYTYTSQYISIWDLKNSNRAFLVESEPWTSFSISEDGRYFSLFTKGMIHLYDVSSGRLLYKYLSLDGGNSLVLDPGNHYDGSEVARQLVYFTCGTEVISLSQVKDQLWVPNLAARIMKGETINAASLSDLNICGVTPVIEERKKDDAWHFLITPRKGGLGETVLYVNDIEVKRYQPAALTKSGTGFELQVSKSSLQQYFIDGNNNTVTVKSFTRDNDISSRGLIIRHKSPAKDNTPPNLYAVMVGVSDYKGTELDLKYAAKDADDLSATLAASARKLLNKDGREHVFIYNLTTAEKRTAFPEKQAIRQVFEEIGRKATAKDILFIFFAGHGVMEGDKESFYFLTADASKDADVAKTGISISELNEWMKPQHIKAQKRVLIFDACNSGQAINELVTIGNKDDQYVAARNDDESNRIKAVEKLNERSGMFILSASASNQYAYELGKYSQGVLTYVLLKSIKENPLILEENNLLNVDKWFAVAEKNVTEIVSQTGNRQHPQKFGTGGFNIGMVDSEVLANIHLPQDKPLFTASNFFNPQAGDDDLELSKEVNNQLNRVSTRGTGVGISYMTVTNAPEAYTMTGTYEVTGSEIRLKVNIKQYKAVVHRFEITGNTGNLSQLSEELLKKVEHWVQNKQ